VTAHCDGILNLAIMSVSERAARSQLRSEATKGGSRCTE
jgi:hypothetical protein